MDVATVLKPPSRDESPAEAVDEIDPSVFNVKLWNPSPPPPSEPEVLAAKLESPRPLKLQLIGIITEAGTHNAAVYDPDSDRLLIVSSGDKIAEQTITSVNPTTVVLTDGRTTRTLSLKEDQS